MKKFVLAAVLAVFVSGTAVMAGEAVVEKKAEATKEVTAKFVCKKCKTSADKAGKCEKCGKEMEEVKAGAKAEKKAEEKK